MQPAGLVPKEKDRQGGLAACGFNLKKKKTDKKEGLQLAGSIPKEKDRQEGGLAAPLVQFQRR